MADEKKVVPLANEYTNKHEQQKKERRRIFYRNRRLKILGGVGLAIILLAGISWFQSYRELQNLQQEHAQVVTEKKELVEQQTQLKSDVALLKDDEYVAKLARSRFYMTKEGEQVYAIQQSSDANVEQADNESAEKQDTSSSQNEE